MSVVPFTHLDDFSPNSDDLPIVCRKGDGQQCCGHQWKYGREAKCDGTAESHCVSLPLVQASLKTISKFQRTVPIRSVGFCWCRKLSEHFLTKENWTKNRTRQNKKRTNTEFHFLPMVEKIFHGTRFGLTSKLNCSKEEKNCAIKILALVRSEPLVLLVVVLQSTGAGDWKPPPLCWATPVCSCIHALPSGGRGEGSKKEGGGGITSAKKIVKKNVCIKIVVAWVLVRPDQLARGGRDVAVSFFSHERARCQPFRFKSHLLNSSKSLSDHSKSNLRHFKKLLQIYPQETVIEYVFIWNF